MTAPQKRRQLARSISSQLENDSFLKDDLHAELAARKMEPLACPTITENLDLSDYGFGTVKESLESIGMLSMEPSGYEAVKGMVEGLVEADYCSEDETIWGRLAKVRFSQCSDDEDPDDKVFAITPHEYDLIVCDMVEKLEKLQNLIDALAE